MLNKLSDKKIHIEFLRIIAIFLVIFNHTGQMGFFLFSISHGLKYWIYLFISISCKIAVPIFFMISGALLLSKNESMKVLYKKRVFRMIVVILLFSFIVCLFKLYKNGGDLNIYEFFRTVYSSRYATAYWYLYAYLGLLITLPILRKLVVVLENGDFKYLIIGNIVLGSLNIISYLIWKETVNINASFYPVFIMNNPVFYFMIGYYVEHRIDINKIQKKHILCLAILSFILIVVCCIMTYFRGQVMGGYSESNSQRFHNVLIVIPTIWFYISTKWYISKVKLNDLTTRVIILIGSLTFGVMLLEQICRIMLVDYFIKLKVIMPTMISALLWSLSAFILSAIITYFLKKIPYLKKLI